MGWAAVLGLTVGGIALTATPAWTTEVQACDRWANAPYQSGSFVEGVVGRGGCGNLVNLQSWLFADLTLWPDPNIGYGSANLVNGSVTGAGPCSREGRDAYYNQARTDTGERSGESQRRVLC
ncbi:hypothetical protein JOF56_008496 [Kibdelosporangium banguiense]|uniref:Secreted protein n=1 Tax=Kibdelosporangium banguiense TaxID=1365924 RepID=A0ABS4TUL4_9PSEU|nr:hypothetical protein [Kibdelosporangium banguiense]MBP2328111.1 hypothetical protein [Kibdelosporangium banguiense]